MDRIALKNLTHNAKDFLTATKPDYKQWVFRYTFLELEKDLSPNGDITSESVVKDNPVVTGNVVAGEDGILAGAEEIRYFLVDSDPRFKPRLGELQVAFFKKDGEKIKKGEKIMEIIGKARDILAVERVVLNLLMRMSGIASKTFYLVEMLKKENLNTLLTPTRKTLWGLLDKKAVTVGGGGTHRLSLSDAILIKDNHLAILGGSITTALKNASDKAKDARFIEIEVENASDAISAAEGLTNFVSHEGIQAPACVMFDNMKALEIIDALAKIKEKGCYDKVLFEASGGINEENLVEYAKTGVDIISMGSLTTSVPSLNFSLEIFS